MKKFNLWECGTPYYNEKFDSDYNFKEIPLTWYEAEGNGVKGAVVVCPGGGYAMRADHEGSGYAKYLAANGYHAFVVDYRVAPYRHPVEISDALRAIRFVRYNAEKFGVDPNKIAIMGSSAGGHLALSASEHFDIELPIHDDIDRVSAKPNGTILCYPVVSTVEKYSHFGSRYNLIGNPGDEALAEKLSGEKNVREDMAPVFIWHTFEDTCVPIENSLYLAAALREKKIPTELHVFPYGPHGLGLAPNDAHVAQWGPLLLSWLKLNGFNK